MKKSVKTALTVIAVLVAVCLMGFSLYNIHIRHPELPACIVENGSTLDMHLQAVADSSVKAVMAEEKDLERVAIVLMDVRTGAIRVMVDLMRSRDNTVSGECTGNAVSRGIEPGAVVQTMTLAKLLDDGYIKSLGDTVSTNHGVLAGCPKDQYILNYEQAHGTDIISVLDGYVRSSSYVMAKMAYDAYNDSSTAFADVLRGYCLPYGAMSGIDGFRKTEICGAENHAGTGSYLYSIVNGYSMLMTPLDILSFYNTIASGGKMIRPYLVQSATDGEKKFHSAEVLKKKVISPAVCDTLTRALRCNVLYGTARHLKDARYPVAGKTGTSHQLWDVVGDGSDGYADKDGRSVSAATFVGFFPYDAPEYSIICTMESRPCQRTFYGGTLPVRIVKELIGGMEIKEYTF